MMRVWIPGLLFGGFVAAGVLHFGAGFIPDLVGRLLFSGVIFFVVAFLTTMFAVMREANKKLKALSTTQ